MFTVKWVYEYKGISREKIYSCDQFECAFDNRPPHVGQCSKTLGIYHIPPGGVVTVGDNTNGEKSLALAHGTVFVMNEQGATVAKYKLSNVAALDDYAESAGYPQETGAIKGAATPLKAA